MTFDPHAVALPVGIIRWDDTGAPVPQDFVGSAFSPVPGVVISCAHVLPEPGSTDFFVIPPGNEPGRLMSGLPLANIEHPTPGVDLAMASADLDTGVPMVLVEGHVALGL